MTTPLRTRAPRFLAVAAAALALVITGAACEPDVPTPDPGTTTTTSGATTTTSPTTTAVPTTTTTGPTSTTTPSSTTTTTRSPSTTTTRPSTTTTTAPPVGNPGGHAAVPPEAQAVDTSRPTRVIGTGAPASCTADAVVAAVAAGGIITFNCGPNPVTIAMTQTAKVFNDASPDVVIDGGGKVTLSGGGSHRILYMNTCDQAQHWTTSHCQDQDTPRLVVQNLALVDGNSIGQPEPGGGGGGAVFVRGGRFKVVGSTFKRNRCDDTGPDVGGAALRVLSQSQGLPVYVTGSTFGGSSSDGNTCSNGGALSSIGVSWVVLNSVMNHNTAIGNGANPARSGTPGGGSGGAIYLDGNTFTLTVSGSSITDNHANEGGGAIFFVSNDRSGTMTLDQGTTLARNSQDGFGTSGLPGIFILAKSWSTTGATLS